MEGKVSFSIYPLLIMALLVVTTVYGCKKDNSDLQVKHKLGENYQGGIIFNLNATLEHGLIAATSDQSSFAYWWNGSFISTGATSMTDGSSNTTAIIQKQGNSGSYAAKLCRDFNGGGFKDWFLPSKDQLNILYLQKTLVGGFSEEFYWSSTEYDYGQAWVQYFLNGTQYCDNKSDGANVHTRAIRAF